jgi:predicted O-methyltransferase YrrM
VKETSAKTLKLTIPKGRSTIASTHEEHHRAASGRARVLGSTPRRQWGFGRTLRVAPGQDMPMDCYTHRTTRRRRRGLASPRAMEGGGAMPGDYSPARTRLLRTLPILQAMQRIPGYLSEEEADLLIAAAAHTLRTLERADCVVELGSFHGRSTVLLGMVAKTVRPEAKVYAIDPHQGEISSSDPSFNVEPSFGPFLRNISNAGLIDIVIPIKERSGDVQWNRPIGLLFIDALHDYDSVAQDFARFAPWVVPGGLIAFHDYGHPYFPGVATFVDEIVDRGSYQPVQCGAGLIILEKLEERDES